MLRVNNLVGFGVGGGALPFGVTWIDKASSTTNAAAYDFGSWAAANAGILCVVALTSNNGGPSLDNCVIGPSTVSFNQDGTSGVRAGVAVAPVAAGSHNITVNMTTTEDWCAIGVWLVTGASNGSSDSAGDTSVTSITWSRNMVAANIACVGVAHANTNGTSWPAGTEEDEVNVDGYNCSWVTLTGVSGSPYSLTPTWSTSANAAIAGRNFID